MLQQVFIIIISRGCHSHYLLLQHVFRDVLDTTLIVIVSKVQLIFQPDIFGIDHVVFIVFNLSTILVLMLLLLKVSLTLLLLLRSGTSAALLRVDHLCDLLHELEQVDTVLGVPIDDLVAADVRKVVL